MENSFVFTTINGAAAQLGIPACRIRAWAKQGKVPGFYSGSRLMVDVGRLREKIETGAFLDAPGERDGDGEAGRG